jgi:hypothetical protein
MFASNNDSTTNHMDKRSKSIMDSNPKALTLLASSLTTLTNLIDANKEERERLYHAHI